MLLICHDGPCIFPFLLCPQVSWDIPELVHPVSEVSCKQPYTVGKGDIKIKYRTLEQLEAVCRKLGG